MLMVITEATEPMLVDGTSSKEAAEVFHGESIKEEESSACKISKNCHPWYIKLGTTKGNLIQLVR